jgi:leucyl aminopeptidase (aminopeptidase T)
MDIGCRSVYVSDGIISTEDLKNGRAGSSVYLPAGEVFLTPVPGSVNGKVVIDLSFFQGTQITGLTLNIENGKVTSMEAETGLDSFKDFYDAQGEGMDLFSFIDFGINSNVKIPSGSTLMSYMPVGMVTVGIGNNIWAGGSNNANSGFSFFQPGCTVKLDDQIILEKGEFNM